MVEPPSMYTVMPGSTRLGGGRPDQFFSFNLFAHAFFEGERGQSARTKDHDAVGTLHKALLLKRFNIAPNGGT